MKATMLVRAAIVLALLVLVGWVIHKTHWVERQVDDPIRGAAATDKYYSLTRLLKAAGTTLEVRTALEPLPPPGATLVINSSLWTVFPGRDERLKAWVESGGHLVVHGVQLGSETLRWLPLSFREPPQSKPVKSVISAASAAASAAKDDDEDDDDDGQAQQAVPAPPGKADDLPRPPASRPNDRWSGAYCTGFVETAATTQPAFEPDRRYRACMGAGTIRPLGRKPTWVLANDKQTLAMRVPFGRGTVTGVAIWTEMSNRGLLRGDTALVTAAILQAAPGRAVWLVTDEAREPFALWLWHETRVPLLLCATAIALALWRLMVRFGPPQALPPRARRSMGEQVRGTGQFIAAGDIAALHAATRRAFEDTARPRVEGWNDLGDEDRVAALAKALAPAVSLDVRAVLAALNPGPNSTPIQWRAAIRVVEQARRVLLRAARQEHFS